MPTDQDWRRLGELLIARRVALGFPKRLTFARDRGFTHDRTLSDIVNARRTNFDPATLAQIEQAYEWAPRSVLAVLDGGEPVELGRSESVVPDHDAADAVMLSLPAEAVGGLTEAERAELEQRAKGEALRIAREIRRDR